MQETQAWSLDQEDPLEKEMTIHSKEIYLLGKSHDRGAHHATVHGVTKELDTNEQLNHWMW